jgi:hypothetical protein
MEFHHRKDLSKTPFNLDLSDTELWDLVRTGRLQPFTEVQIPSYNSTVDLLSEDYTHEPLFPRGPLKEKYKRFRFLQQQIDSDKKFINKSEDQAWKELLAIRRFDYYGQTVPVNKNASHIIDVDFEKKLDSEKKSFFEYRKSLKKETRQSLEVNEKEAAELEKEFRNLPKLYQMFITDIPFDLERKNFVEQLNDAYYRRNQIEALVKIEAQTQLSEASDLEQRGEPPQSNKEFPEVEDLIAKAIPEIERILSAMRSVGFSRKYYNQREEQIEDKWKDEALDCFDDNKEEFSLIKREYLEDDLGLFYSLAKTQEPRDFRGILLQKIIQDHSPKTRKYGVQRLDKKYREILDRSRPVST